MSVENKKYLFKASNEVSEYRKTVIKNEKFHFAGCEASHAGEIRSDNHTA